ncbi:hypothetical protein AOC36_03955 [Erysipelothrix larvae]|uniref:HTH marR-type domain-containing protein n=1 Tax=Erysipelothrix larvae TaxID=1514105 RepID=A0A120JTK5_9FIRM|nr:MarR family transcriptional regulator [Erysipelothrix larvae]AMC93153.1 hypothetical protein AOC36_03955 [Erysipelothrix larvae]
MFDLLTETFRAMAHKQRNALRTELAKHGLYLGQHRILFLLKDQPGLSQVEICDNLNVTKESLSLSLKRLHNADLVYCEKDDHDKRKTLWSLTNLGLEKAQVCKKGFKSVNESMFGELSHEEMIQLESYFNKMIRGLERREIDEEVI